MTRVRVLLVADTHLGFDEPVRPAASAGASANAASPSRLRRGPDFFRNLELALQPALHGAADLVIHAGDLFHRSRVSPGLVERAFAPLKRVGDAGVPVVVVPGNHERSTIPYPLLTLHPQITIVKRPRTLRMEMAGCRVAIAAWPYVHDVRGRFGELLADTGVHDAAGGEADLRLLVLHQTVEGATVGPVDYVFRRGDDVIRGRDIPAGFAAVLSGHIHRHQVLTHDLAGSPLATPVYYPGSVERTTTAERHEPKGYLTLAVEPDATGSGGRVADWTFHELPSRPVEEYAVDPTAYRRDPE